MKLISAHLALTAETALHSGSPGSRVWVTECPPRGEGQNFGWNIEGGRLASPSFWCHQEQAPPHRVNTNIHQSAEWRCSLANASEPYDDGIVSIAYLSEDNKVEKKADFIYSYFRVFNKTSSANRNSHTPANVRIHSQKSPREWIFSSAQFQATLRFSHWYALIADALIRWRYCHWWQDECGYRVIQILGRSLACQVEYDPCDTWHPQICLCDPWARAYCVKEPSRYHLGALRELFTKMSCRSQKSSRASLHPSTTNKHKYNKLDKHGVPLL